MARPVQADAAATRKRILTGASKAFSTAGVDGCSVREIARDAGVSVATIHHYFGSKDGLHTACLDAMYEDLSGLQETLLSLLAESPDRVLEQVVRQSWRFARSHRLQLRLLMREVVSRGGLDASRRSAYWIPFLDQGSVALAELSGRDPASMRLALQSVVNLVVRYALGNAAEVHGLTGERGTAGESALEAHLVEVVHALVYGGGVR